MLQAKSIWSKVDRALVSEVALVCQKNLVHALRDSRRVAYLRKQCVPAWMKARHLALPVAEFGSEEDRTVICQTIHQLGGYVGELTGLEERDVYALDIWLADTLLLFAAQVEPLVRNCYPVAIRGGLLEGRMALWAVIEDLEALLALVAPAMPPPVSELAVSGPVEQGSLWTDMAWSQGGDEA